MGQYDLSLLLVRIIFSCKPYPFLRRITTDNIDGTSKLMDHLVSAGRKKIAIINYFMRLEDSRERFDTYRGKLSEYNLQYDEKLTAYVENKKGK